ncbi:AAA family ATPase [Aminipila butyrica]|uniref:nitrogenase n=2 Tax=Aminipila butyrica TaxID=433296 RepID=A0A858C1Z5_9FIRM|nr:AAA family ATPase [Aminipila butyrica]
MKQEIAIYGKGGIGKSTLSANLSAALADWGKSVLQIGCDPKHDSTRLLLNGRKITTILDYIKMTGALDYKKEDILFQGYQDIGCVEAGGPEPGVGCAGRGIITAFELLEQFKIKAAYDIILYDVLGDVVCGGFAVPIRREYADTIFLVTSGEYMAMYAANNILRGIKNYDTGKCRVAGLLYNSRNVEDEDRKVAAFAAAVGLPICAKIPRSDVFAQAERENKTVVELLSHKGAEEDVKDLQEEEQKIKELFRSLSQTIIEGIPLYEAKPLTDDELEAVIYNTVRTAAGASEEKSRCAFNNDLKEEAILKEESGGTREGKGNELTAAKNTDTHPYLSKNVIRNEPLHGCAFNGAVTMSVHLTDAVVLAHGPKSCAYLSYQTISSAGRRRLFERGSLMPVAISPNFQCTDMNETDMIFGGTQKLMETVEAVKRQKPKAIIVISSCPAGIIGDDIERVKGLAEPDLPIVTIKTDGNLSGDYLQGMLLCYTELAAQVIDKSVRAEKKVVNIVFEKVVAKNTESNFQIIKAYLDQLNISVNCRFLCNTSFDSLKNFCKAELNLLAYRDYTGMILEKFFTETYQCKFFTQQFPVGFAETEQWLLEISAAMGERETAEKIVMDNKQIYEKKIGQIKETLKGKRLLIITYNHNLDWILTAALDAGLEVVKIGILNFSQDEGFRTQLHLDCPIEENYDKEEREKDIEKYQPDILLSNYESGRAYKHTMTDTIPMCPDVGFFSGCNMVERWASLIKSNLQGEWKQDERLFAKYYTG